MAEYIEQFWRAATPADAIKEPPMVARFRGEDKGDWFVANLFGYRRGDYCWLCDELLGIWAKDCEVYDEPGWHKNKPEPGEGYRLLEKFPEPESIITGDEFRFGNNWYEAGTGDQEATAWYRRKIEPAAVTEAKAEPIMAEFEVAAPAESVKNIHTRPGWRYLEIGEVLQEGDEWFNSLGRWQKATSFFRLSAFEHEGRFARRIEAAVDEPVKLVAHPIQLDDSGVWRFKSTPIQDRSYAVLNNRGYYLQWLAGKRPEYQPEFRHAFTPARLLQVSIRELGRNIRLRAVEPVDADTLKQQIRQELQPKALEQAPTYEPGKVYEYNGRKFRLATSRDMGSDCYCSNQSLEAAVKAERVKTLLEHKQISLYYYVNDGEEHWKWAFIEIKQPQEPKYVPFEWQDRDLLRNRYIRRDDDPDREYLILEIVRWMDGTIEVKCRDKSICVRELLRDYVFDDDTPCGKRVEQ